MPLLARCDCRSVVVELHAAPIGVGVCFCDDCQRAGRLLEHLPGAPALLRADGGTEVVFIRKDAVGIVAGEEFLVEHRLSPHSPTRRVVASCCNTPMFGDFTPGFWMSLYRDRLDDDDKGVAGPVRLRAHSARFMATLAWAWLRMGLRRPKLRPYPPLDLR